MNMNAVFVCLLFSPRVITAVVVIGWGALFPCETHEDIGGLEGKNLSQDYPVRR